MSHFFVAVIVPKGTQAKMQDEVQRLLAPYSEEIEVAEYDKECGCIGRLARENARIAARIAADLKYGTIDDNRKRFRDREAIAPYNKLEQETFEADEGKNKPDPACTSCHGTGLYKSTYNPKSRWDWWRIGGRWDGEIAKIERSSSDGGFNFDSVHEQIENNSISVLFLNKDNPPYAYITPDGEWHEKGSMGWFGMSFNEKDEEAWIQEWKDTIENFSKPSLKHYVAIGVDCHI